MFLDGVIGLAVLIIALRPLGLAKNMILIAMDTGGIDSGAFVWIFTERGPIRIANA
jgi:hypothetical protein